MSEYCGVNFLIWSFIHWQEVNETEYSTTLIETKLKKMVAQIEKEIAKKDEELQIKKEKPKKGKLAVSIEINAF